MNLEAVKIIASGLREDFGVLRYKTIKELPCTVKNYGYCDEEGNIEIRLKSLNRPDKELARSTVIRTLIHELAHLFELNHRKGFKIIEKVLLAWARKRGLF